MKVWVKVISGSNLNELIYTVKIIIGSRLLLRDESFLESRQTTVNITFQVCLQIGDKKHTHSDISLTLSRSGNELKRKSDQLHELSCTEVNFPALGSAHHSFLIGHILQGAFLVLWLDNTSWY